MCVDIQPVPVLKDNYAWLIRSERGGTIVVDPGDDTPIVEALGGQKLDAILLTHYHNDHTAGANALKSRYGAMIYGPGNVNSELNYCVKGGEELSIAAITVQVLATPGHATGHVSYIIPSVPALFSGDVLFSAGSGRLLDGTAEELFQSLRLYDSLPDKTLLCAGHEYTATNLKFVAAQGHKSPFFRKRLEEVHALRGEEKPSLPVTMGVERKVNPFLQARSVEELAHLRHLKDNFSAS